MKESPPRVQCRTGEVGRYRSNHGYLERQAHPVPRLCGWGVALWAACAQPCLAGGGDGAARPEPEPLRISIIDAVLLGLEHNRALRVERFAPAMAETRAAEARGQFDAYIAAGVSGGRESGIRTGLDPVAVTTERTETEVEVGRRLISGAGVGMDTSWRRDGTGSPADVHRLRVGVWANQPLLRGRGARAERSAIEQAELDARISEHELRAFTESLVAEIKQTLWDYALATRRIEIVSESAELAQQQLREVERRIEVGALAETERAAARTELALRREALINARSAAKALRYRIWRHLSPDGDWEQAVELVDEPDLAVVWPEPEPPDRNVARAMANRPELHEAGLMLERGELDVVRTRDGLLPRLDFFVRLGQTAYAAAFDDTTGELGGTPDWSAGVRLETPFSRRPERARHARSQLALERTREALRNLESLIRLEVLTGALELGRAAEQISATAATRALQEETLRAETQKFQVGRSTSLFVAQAQRDVMASRIAEVEALTVYLQARIRLYRLEGTLLERLGIQVN